MAKWALLALVLTPAIAAAESYKDRHQSDLDQTLERTNKMCGTAITLAPIDWAAWEKASGKAQDCAPILDALKLVCRQDNKDEPHPAALAFMKDKVKSVRCALLPDNNKSEEKVTIQGGVITFARVPQYSPTGEVVGMLLRTAELAKLPDVRREWEIENVDGPKAAESLKKRCGDDMKLTIDLASWRLAGKDGNLPNALDIGEMCQIYASGVADACNDDKTVVRKQFDVVRCSYGKAIKGKATVAFKGREVVVTSGPTIGFGDGALVREAVDKKLGTKKKKK
jgi:hypothetical protein